MTEDGDHAEQLARSDHRDPHDGPVAVDLLPAVCVVGIGRRVVHVDDPTLDRRPRGGAGRVPGRWDSARRTLGAPARPGDWRPPATPPVEPEDERPFRLTQADRVLGQRVEDRLEIERGPPDHLEQLAGRRLLLERDPQLAVPRLELLEQAHVLDGDHGLVAEGLQELDMAGRELPRLGAPTTMTPIGLPSARIIGTPSRPAIESGPPVLRILRVGQQVRDLRNGSVQDRPPRHLRTGRRHRVRRCSAASARGLIVMRHQMEKGPSNWYRAPVRAPDSCTALRTIVMNTGWTSVGEL